MSPTDTSEKGLETLIVESLVNEAGYVLGTNDDYSREYVIDLARLRMFLEATQPERADDLALNQDCPKRTQFLHRLDAEIAKRGVIDVLRKGVKHGPDSLELFYGTTTLGSAQQVSQAGLVQVHPIPVGRIVITDRDAFPPVYELFEGFFAPSGMEHKEGQLGIA